MRLRRPVWSLTREQSRMPAAVAASILAVVLLVSGCSAGADATSSGGSFDFVAPGGQTDIFYDPPKHAEP